MLNMINRDLIKEAHDPELIVRPYVESKNKMKSLMIKLSFLVLILYGGCEKEKPQTELDRIQGIWQSTFEVTYQPEMDIGTENTVEFISKIEFQDDLFTITVDPPVHPSFLPWWTDSKSEWFGKYNIEDDTIFFIVADTSLSKSPYQYEMKSDSLYLSMIYESTDEGIMLVPLGGGLPWGHAGMIQHGWFEKVEE